MILIFDPFFARSGSSMKALKAWTETLSVESNARLIFIVQDCVGKVGTKDNGFRLSNSQ